LPVFSIDFLFICAYLRILFYLHLARVSNLPHSNLCKSVQSVDNLFILDFGFIPNPRSSILFIL
ncbi:MAG: hypothetical protein IT364_02105, partial [Candidatus Hydrogenedentes bacterium]|nr:hypothetical protein [Candidatus Hydrogenedentota bacterium]